MTPDQITDALAAPLGLDPRQTQAIHDAIGGVAEGEPSCLLEVAEAAAGVPAAELLAELTRYFRGHAMRLNLSRVTHDPAVLGHVRPADAWDYLVLPLALGPEGHLVCATTEETLDTALAFMLRSLAVPFDVVIADVRPLEQFIAERYHYEGVEIDAA
ncbi:MAG: hypothetical protein AAF800_14870 [Planctomycetota bacterium]